MGGVRGWTFPRRGVDDCMCPYTSWEAERQTGWEGGSAAGAAPRLVHIQTKPTAGFHGSPRQDPPLHSRRRRREGAQNGLHRMSAAGGACDRFEAWLPGSQERWVPGLLWMRRREERGLCVCNWIRGCDGDSCGRGLRRGLGLMKNGCVSP